MLGINKCDVELSKNVSTKDGFSEKNAIEAICNFLNESFDGRVLKKGYRGFYYRDISEGYYILHIKGVAYIRNKKDIGVIGNFRSEILYDI